jgi:peptide/nickel transport system substrate-binding protein
MKRLLLAASFVFAGLAGAISAANAQRPVVVGQTFLAESLDPAQGSAGWALQSHGLAETLFTVDRMGRVVPNLAQSAARDGDGWRIELQPGVRFGDGSPLDASAVRDALVRSTRESPRARAQTGQIEIDILNAHAVRLRTELPLAAIESVLAEFPLVVYRVEGERFHFTGPYRAVEFRRGESLRLEPNPHYRVSANRPPVIVRRVADTQTLALGLESGEIDIAFNLAVETLPRLARRTGITVKSTPVAYQYMAFLNTTRPPFDDVRVRRAIDLAVDRAQLVEAVRGGEIATGMYPRFFPFASPERRPTDPVEAAHLLDAAGWLAGANGQRFKDGRPLEFVLTAYPQRPDFLTLAPVLRAQLERLGFRVRLETSEAITPQLQAKRFDMAFWAMHAAPGGDGAFVFEQFLRSRGPTNFAGLADAGIDAALDRLRPVDAPAARAAGLRAAEALVFAQAPIVYLMTPVWHVGLSARVADYVLYPSDYYVVRADLRARD